MLSGIMDRVRRMCVCVCVRFDEAERTNERPKVSFRRASVARYVWIDNLGESRSVARDFMQRRLHDG